MSAAGPGIPVHAPDGPYAAATAELPLSARRSPERRGAVVVVSGRAGWAARVAEAAADGARAIVLRDPEPGHGSDLAATLDAPPSVAIVVDRPLLRSDLVDDVRRSGTRAPAAVQVECSGSEAEFSTVARDALGWARVLAGGPLRLASTRSTARGFTALLTGPADDRSVGVAVSILATRRPGTAPWIRAIAVGAERTEVTIDLARGSAVVESATEAGRVIHPTRWESAERVVLRRALDALETGSVPAELAELQLDTAVATAADQADDLG